jgi:SAM-dependent methyltransferase
VPDAHYENPALAALYDLESGWSRDRHFYLALASGEPNSILDLGCGTGLLCNEYAAKGHEVTGVDPSKAMLNIARGKPFGSKIEWVHGTAQTYSSANRFDLIVMTGHAFQVLLEEKDVAAAFGTMHSHLKPDGVTVFETRNPDINWADRWNQNYILQGLNGSVSVSRRVKSARNSLIEFETAYSLPSGMLVSASILRFWSRNEIEILAAKAGLGIDWLLGDWDGAAFDANISEEMIFSVRAQ